MRQALIAFAAISVALPSAALAADVGPLKGGWVAEGVSCSALEEYTDERIIKIDDERVEFYETMCVIGALSRNENTYRLELLCESEGETNRSTFEATLTSNDRLRVKDGFEYVRCDGASGALEKAPAPITTYAGYSAYLLETLPTGLQENHAVRLRIIEGGIEAEQEWYVNCNVGYRQVVPSDGPSFALDLQDGSSARTERTEVYYRLWEKVCGEPIRTPDEQEHLAASATSALQCPSAQGVYSAPEDAGTMIIKRIGYLDRGICSGDLIRANYNDRELYFVFVPMKCGEIDVMFWDDHSNDNVKKLSSVRGRIKWSERELQPLPEFSLPPQTGTPPGGTYTLRACYNGE